MYSMVLMAALTASPDAVGFGRGGFGGCGGCTGAVVAAGCSGCTGTSSCFGSCYGSCTGSCYGSCTGSCYGSCTGGGRGLFPLFPGLRSRLAGAFGRGCTGSSCYGSGCYSSCQGASCYSTGFGSCYGSCSGAVVVPSYGCTGYAPPAFGSGSCLGTSGPVYYGADFQQGVVAPPVTGSGIVEGFGGVASAVPTVTIDQTTEYRAAQAKPEAAPARLTIELPATAKLYVDGQLVKGESVSRNFHTPDLPTGKTFYYDLKAEVAVNGKLVTEDKRVLVKAGDVSTESFEKLIAAVKSDKTDVATK